MVAGGPRLAWLEAIRARHPLSLHGVALSLAADAAARRGAPAPPRRARRCASSPRSSPSISRGRPGAARIAPTCCRFRAPARRWRASPTTSTARRTRSAAGSRSRTRRTTSPCDGHEWDEIDFLEELARRTGCRLLLDVNNVYVSARNLGLLRGGLSRRVSRRARRGDPSRRAHRRPDPRRRAAHRLARCAGRPGGVGALRAADRAHRPAADADRARRQRARVRRRCWPSASARRPCLRAPLRRGGMMRSGIRQLRDSRTHSRARCSRRNCARTSLRPRSRASSRSPPSRSTATR